MSNQFGSPPPPPSQVLEPRAPTAPAAPADDAPYFVPETDPWRRRAAVALAFVAVGLLVFANLATWLHFTVMSPAVARGSVATATLDDARVLVAKQTAPDVTSAVRAEIDRREAAGLPVPPAQVTGLDVKVARAVDAALATPAFADAWRDALATTAARQRALAGGSALTADEQIGTVLRADLAPLARPIRTSLAAQGITFMATAPVVLTPFTVSTSDTAADHQLALGLPGALWWLLIALSIAATVGALVLASRPFRLAKLMAIDAAIMLGGCLLLVPLIGQVVDDQAVDPAQSVLLTAGFHAMTRTLIIQTVVLMALSIAAAVALTVYTRSRGPEGVPTPAA